MPKSPLDPATLTKALNWAYERAIDGVAGLHSAERLAAAYADRPDFPDAQAQRLVRGQVPKAVSAGFVAGLGGALTMPVSIPANLAAVLFIQLRMVAAIAFLGGHDVRSDRVRGLAFACLCGSVATEVVKDAGLQLGAAQLGASLSNRALRGVSFEVLKKLNDIVQVRLLAKFGEQGLLKFSRFLPIAGGVLGGSFDGASTYAVGVAARQLFTQNKHPKQ